jgi:malonate-semialdehyde dehydrogenase (acetylating)/methylmalonate-semialdehyde dehydrogenase
MGRYQALIRQYQSEIAACITLEQGKTHADAMGDVFRGLQVVDTATAIPTLMKGESVEVAKDMDTYSIRNPLGVAAAICPFNFPAMSKPSSSALLALLGRLTRGRS